MSHGGAGSRKYQRRKSFFESTPRSRAQQAGRERLAAEIAAELAKPLEGCSLPSAKERAAIRDRVYGAKHWRGLSA